MFTSNKCGESSISKTCEAPTKPMKPLRPIKTGKERSVVANLFDRRSQK